VTPADQFLDNLPVIEGVIAFIGRRQRLSPTDRDDFASYARLKLIENDYRILRQFGDRSSLRTYLVTVVHRLFLDYRIAQWGKWRPSAEAKRLGPLAVSLERLLSRERLTLHEAVEQLVSTAPDLVSRDVVEALAEQLPTRMARQTVGEEALDQVAVDALGVEEGLVRAEHAGVKARALSALTEALARLPCEDRLLVRLRFESGLSMPQIAALRQVEHKPLYRRMDRLLKQLRGDLEQAGVAATEVRQLLADPDGPHSAIVEVSSGAGGRGGCAVRPSL
jgi:RNA polymerase sigma factor (sigma-70 family)